MSNIKKTTLPIPAPKSTSVATPTPAPAAPSTEPVVVSNGVHPEPEQVPVAEEAKKSFVLPNLSAKSTVVAKSPVKGLKSPTKDTCPECQGQFLSSTLKKNKGTCGRCLKKKLSPAKSKTKSPCESCQNEFLVSTLEKNNGMCGRCAQKNAKETNGPVFSSTGKPKEACPDCGHFYLPETLANNPDKICSRCVVKRTKEASGIPTAKKVSKEKGKCGVCSREFHLSTLEAGGGTCGTCRNKAQRTPKADKKAVTHTLGTCLGCKRAYTQATLDNNSGFCKSCYSTQPSTVAGNLAATNGHPEANGTKPLPASISGVPRTILNRPPLPVGKAAAQKTAVPLKVVAAASGASGASGPMTPEFDDVED